MLEFPLEGRDDGRVEVGRLLPELAGRCAVGWLPPRLPEVRWFCASTIGVINARLRKATAIFFNIPFIAVIVKFINGFIYIIRYEITKKFNSP